MIDLKKASQGLSDKEIKEFVNEMTKKYFESLRLNAKKEGE